MTSEELFELSKKNTTSLDKNSLSNRAYWCLVRAELVDNLHEDNEAVNHSKVKQMIISGNMWAVRGVGEATMKELCEWVIKNEPD